MPTWPPEQALGEALDARSDVFSLGVVLYEACTGVRPFSGKTLPAFFDALLHDEAIPARTRNPRITAELNRIIHRALARDPKRRQQSAKQMENELLAVMDASRGSRMVGAWKSVAIAGAAVAAAIACGITFLCVPRQAHVVVTVSQATDVSGRAFPSLAPDGKTFVFVGRQDGQWDIYSQRVGGHNATSLTNDCKFDDTQPSFSPDGERIPRFGRSAMGGHLRHGSDG